MLPAPQATIEGLHSKDAWKSMDDALFTPRDPKNVKVSCSVLSKGTVSSATTFFITAAGSGACWQCFKGSKNAQAQHRKEQCFQLYLGKKS